MPEHPGPPPPPGGGGGKVEQGAMFQWIVDVVTGPYKDHEKEKAIQDAYVK